MATITGSTTSAWSSVSLNQVDFAANFVSFGVRLSQLMMEFRNIQFAVESASSTRLVVDMFSGGRMTLTGTGLTTTPVIRTIDFRNPPNGSGEVIRATGTFNGGTEVLTSATVGSAGFSETVNGTVQLIPTSGTYTGALTSLVAQIGSATVTFRGSFGLSGNLSAVNMTGTVTSITVANGGSTITMAGLSLSLDELEAALTANTLTTVNDLFSYVGQRMTGNDTITYTNNSGAGMSFYGGPGHDVITIGGPHGDTLVGGDGNDVLDGGLGQDTINGGAGNDRITMLVTPGNTDTINAGTDSDTLVLSGVVPGSQEVVVNLSSTTDQVVSIGGVADGLAQTNFEHLDASGMIGFVTVTGSAGDNVLIGSPGNDVLNGGAGNDTLIGGLGDDTYRVDSAGDIVLERRNAGLDKVFSTIDYTLGANLENLELMGSANLNGRGNTLANSLIGNSGHNTLEGLDGDDTLIGGAGNDTLIGGAGNDTLIGGAGNDTYVIGQGTDTLIEAPGEGIDLVQSAITHTLGANFERLTLTGTRAINGTGNDLANVLTGNNAANVLVGGAGDDTLIGHGGHDRLDGGTGNDAMDGGAGHDTYIVDSAGDTVTETLAGAAGGTDLVRSAVSFTLGANLERLTLTGTASIDGTGNELNNVLIGNSGNNVLTGGAGHDTLIGGAGDDVLEGGLGNDTLNGGSGNDLYLFGRGHGQDVIQDHGGAADRIEFGSGIDPSDLILRRQANDLRITIYGSSDRMTIQNWYRGAAHQIETIQAGTGHTLLHTQVTQLLQAMAQFTTQTGLSWEAAAGGAGTAQQQADFQNILAANWQ